MLTSTVSIVLNFQASVLSGYLHISTTVSEAYVFFRFQGSPNSLQISIGFWNVVIWDIHFPQTSFIFLVQKEMCHFDYQIEIFITFLSRKNSFKLGLARTPSRIVLAPTSPISLWRKLRTRKLCHDVFRYSPIQTPCLSLRLFSCRQMSVRVERWCRHSFEENTDVKPKSGRP